MLPLDSKQSPVNFKRNSAFLQRHPDRLEIGICHTQAAVEDRDWD